jgi:exoribonuclease R
VTNPAERRVRGPGDDEESPLGPSGNPEWRITVLRPNPADEGFFEDTFHVFAATSDGAKALAYENRLDFRTLRIARVPGPGE